MASLYEAQRESWGFQGRFWQAGEIATVSPEEEKDPSLVHFKPLPKETPLPIVAEPEPESTYSEIAKKQIQRPKTGMLAK